MVMKAMTNARIPTPSETPIAKMSDCFKPSPSSLLLELLEVVSDVDDVGFL